jgi:hypothetical protein
MDDSVPDVRDQIEKLAEANHDVYLAGQAKISGASQQANMGSYADLPAHEKEQNRAAVRDIPVKLGEIGYVITRKLPGDTLVTIPKEDIEKLAELEHLRWTRAKLGEGWRHAPKRDNEKLTHPDMLPWKHPPHQAGARFKFTSEELERLGSRELSETAKQKDRDLVEGIPTILEKADLTIKRIDPGEGS